MQHLPVRVRRQNRKEKEFIDRINDKTNGSAKISLGEIDYFECQ